MGIEDKATRTVVPGSVNVPQRYASYMDDTVRKIVERGNDAEIRSSKDGIKILEVSKKLVAVIPKE